MRVDEIGHLYNRAFAWTWEKQNLLGTWLVLFCCAWIFVFFHAVATNASEWVSLAVGSFPFFISVGLLLAWGIVLTRRYHNHLKGVDRNIFELIKSSWRILGFGLNFSLPIMACFIVLWMALGLFVLVSLIPMIGEFFSVVFSFIPFLILLSMFALFALSFAILYIGAPVLALNSDDEDNKGYKKKVKERFLQDPFINLLLAIFSVLPAIASLAVLSYIYFLTLHFLPFHKLFVLDILQGCMLAVPFTAFLAPATVFFFNMAAEAHVYVLRRAKAASEPSSP